MIRPDLLRALRNDHWERAEHGILFPRQRTLLQGVYSWSVNGRARHEQTNLITTEGLGLIAGDVFPASLYGAIFGNDVTPTAGWAGAAFPGTAGELTSGSEGYVEATRPVLSSLGYSVIEFNMRSASTVQVCGIGLLSTNTKGDTSGSLFSAIRFEFAPETMDDHDILDVFYSLVSVAV